MSSVNAFLFTRFLADAEWETVEKQTEVTDPYKTTDEEVSELHIFGDVSISRWYSFHNYTFYHEKNILDRSKLKAIADDKLDMT